jgi:hypothetical protein
MEAVGAFRVELDRLVGVGHRMLIIPEVQIDIGASDIGGS